MKILLIINYSKYRGGEEAYYDNLKKLFIKNGHEVITYICDSSKIGNQYLAKIKVSLGLFKDNNIDREIIEIAKVQKPDIVHFNNIFPLIKPSIYIKLKKLNIPIVQNIQSYKLLCPKHFLFRDKKICEKCTKHSFKIPSIYYKCYQNSYAGSFIFALGYYLQLLKQAYNYIDAYVFPTTFVKNYHQKFFKFINKKGIVIPNFHNIKIYNNTHEKEEKIKNYFLFIGRISEEKGVFWLLNVFKKLKNINLIVIGHGPKERDLDKFKKYKNIKIIHYLHSSKVFSYIKKATAVIIPSLWFEVFPLVILESWAHKTPVLVPKQGSFVNIIKNLKTGVFYKPNNYVDFVDKINFVLKNPGLIKDIGMNGYLEYKNKYTDEHHYKKIFELYSRLIKKNL